MAADCDDANPCTLDSCDSTTGTCVYEGVDGCCNDTDECASGEVCADDNLCADTTCGTCLEDDDCGLGAGCAALPSGDRCLLLCGEELGACPEDTVCGTAGDGGRQVCVPSAGDCECVRTEDRACRDRDLVVLDSCREAVEVVETCANGCADSDAGPACCPDGTHVAEGECVIDSAEPDADVGGGTDVIESDTVDDVDSSVADATGEPGQPDNSSGNGGSSGGCAAGDGPVPWALWLSLFGVALLVGNVRRRRRTGAARSHRK
jgi:hypothetical protein